MRDRGNKLMGVDRTDYIVYGWKLPFKYFDEKGIDIWEDKKFLPYIEGWKDEKYCIIQDGMSGKYTVFGKLITSAADYEGFNFFEISEDTLQISKTEIINKFQEVFGLSDETIGNPKPLVFNHWS